MNHQTGDSNSRSDPAPSSSLEAMGTPAAKLQTNAPLFRAEALAHAGQRAHGVVLLARPISYSVLTALFCVFALAIIAFLALSSYTRVVDVPGVLVPTRGFIKVIPVQGGLVAESRVNEGQSVQAGDILFVITSERETTGQGNAEQAISGLLNARRESLRRDQVQIRQQYAQRMDATRHRAEDLAADVARIDAEAALQSRRIEMAKTTLQRYTDLAASNFVSPVQVQDKSAELLDQQQRLAELNRSRAASARELSSAQAEYRDLQVQSERDQQAGQRDVSSTELDLTQNEARRQIVIRAPSTGTVSAITVEPGQTVAGSQPLATILPAGADLEAELYAPSRAVGFLRPGMPVQMRYAAFSYEKFGQARGYVREISRTAMRPDELGISGSSTSGEALYRVRVNLTRQSVAAYGVDQPLLAGATLNGSIALDTRRIYEWVLEPLYTITGHLWK